MRNRTSDLRIPRSDALPLILLQIISAITTFRDPNITWDQKSHILYLI